MKKVTFLVLLCLLSFSGFSQTPQTLRVINKQLTLTNGDTVTLRGINYPLIDDGGISLSNAAQYQHKIDQAALTGANCIRLPWYTNGKHWRDVQTPGTINGYVNNGHLSNIIGYCIQKGMIPILELHDPGFITCSNDWTYFNSTVKNWWKSPEVLELIEEHEEHLIINLANEFGYVMWGNDGALNTFKTNYNTLISELRALNVDVPIMIDAPDCGQSSTQLLSIAESMVTSDPDHNLIFSAHAYWYSYANTQAAVQTKLNQANNTNVCFVLGEVANTQDDATCGQYSLANLYPIILQEACTRNIGWLAWTYDQDCSSPRELTSDGEFANLTTYGNDIVYNTTYGLISGTCNAQPVMATNALTATKTLTAYPNPITETVSFTHATEIKQVQVYNLLGTLVKTISSGFTNVGMHDLSAGVYLFKATTLDGRTYQQKIIKN
ncbi:cellulase family glycosylhydrolase [Flavobacterium subsaxonicum]|nr:cellulase family glycosylhydrolase [Flavobacterium subsaxonicum]